MPLLFLLWPQKQVANYGVLGRTAATTRQSNQHLPSSAGAIVAIANVSQEIVLDFCRVPITILPTNYYVQLAVTNIFKFTVSRLPSSGWLAPSRRYLLTTDVAPGFEVQYEANKKYKWKLRRMTCIQKEHFQIYPPRLRYSYS